MTKKTLQLFLFRGIHFHSRSTSFWNTASSLALFPYHEPSTFVSRSLEYPSVHERVFYESNQPACVHTSSERSAFPWPRNPRRQRNASPTVSLYARVTVWNSRVAELRTRGSPTTLLHFPFLSFFKRISSVPFLPFALWKQLKYFILEIYSSSSMKVSLIFDFINFSNERNESFLAILALKRNFSVFVITS